MQPLVVPVKVCRLQGQLQLHPETLSAGEAGDVIISVGMSMLVRGHLCHWLPVTPPGSMAATCQYPLVREKRAATSLIGPAGGATSGSGRLAISTGISSSGTSGSVCLLSGRASDNFGGGGIALFCGHATSGNGANLTMTAGASTEASCAGGTILLEAGVTAGGLGGDVVVSSGQGTSSPGTISVTTGDSTSGASGSLLVTTASWFCLRVTHLLHQGRRAAYQSRQAEIRVSLLAIVVNKS